MRIDYSKRLSDQLFFSLSIFVFENSTALKSNHFIFCKLTEMLLKGSWNVSAYGLVRFIFKTVQYF